MPTLVPIVVTLLAFWAVWKAHWPMKVAIIFTLLIYHFGVGAAFDYVRESSTHANTRHGWYSRYNSAEKFWAKIWIIGFPFVGALSLCFLDCYLPQKLKDWKMAQSVVATHEKIDTGINSVTHPFWRWMDKYIDPIFQKATNPIFYIIAGGAILAISALLIKVAYEAWLTFGPQ